MGIKFVFFGTPEPAVEILEALCAAGYMPALIVTNPDKPKGRDLKFSSSPVKKWALKRDIPCAQPSNLREPVFLRRLAETDADVFVVVAFGSILPKELLLIPKRGALNVHYSLLPKYRGASPVESQILADDRETGVSILLLDEEMDHGPILAQRTVPISPWPPAASELRRKSNEVAGKLLVEILPGWVAGDVRTELQDHGKATYTRKFTAKDREVRLDDDGYNNYLKIQAFSALGTYFFAEKPRKKIRVNIKGAEFGSGRLVITRVVPEGRKEMSYEEFLRGMR